MWCSLSVELQRFQATVDSGDLGAGHAWLLSYLNTSIYLNTVRYESRYRLITTYRPSASAQSTVWWTLASHASSMT